MITYLFINSAVRVLEGKAFEESTIHASKITDDSDKTSSPSSSSNNNKSRMNNSNHRNGPQQRAIDFPLRILVQSEMVGAIIGRAGQTIRNITQQTRYVNY